MSFSNIGKEICEALGLKEVTKLRLTFEVNRPAIAEVEMYLFNEDEGGEIQKILKRYELIEKVDEKFRPISDQARDGFERMLLFPDGKEHWGWFHNSIGRWEYRPGIGPQWDVHPSEPTHYVPKNEGDV